MEANMPRFLSGPMPDDRTCRAIVVKVGKKCAVQEPSRRRHHCLAMGPSGWRETLQERTDYQVQPTALLTPPPRIQELLVLGRWVRRRYCIPHVLQSEVKLCLPCHKRVKVRKLDERKRTQHTNVHTRRPTHICEHDHTCALQSPDE